METKIKKKLIYILSGCLLLIAVLLLIPAVQHFVISFAEFILKRTLRRPEKWINKQILLSTFLIILSFLAFLQSIKRNFDFDIKTQNLFSIVTISALSLSIAVSFFYFFPFYTRYGVDKSVFFYIGKMMTKGMIPYRDLFDHKGILLYFIQYCSALLFPNSTAGVWLFEVLSIFITSLFAYKLLQLFINSKVICILSIYFVFFYMGSKCYVGGNLTEEYALPCITFSYYVFMKYFKVNQYKKIDIVFLGIAFSVVALMRINMAVIWAIFMPIILVKFILNKKFGELLTCTGLFVIGIAIITIPTIVYCIKTDCLRDLWKDYILFNLQYTSNYNARGSILSTSNSFLRFVFVRNPLGILCIMLYFCKFNWTKIELLNIFFFLSTLFFAGVSGRQDINYLIFLLPIYLLPAASIGSKLFSITIQQLSIGSIAKLVCICIAIFFTMATSISILKRTAKHSQTYDIVEKYIIDNTIASDDILVLGNFAHIYLKTGRSSSNKYFYQYPPLTISTEFQTDFCNLLKAANHDYIFLLENLDGYNWINISNSMPNVIKTINELVEKGFYEKIDYNGIIVFSKTRKDTEQSKSTA